MIITVSGKPGSGKSTVARDLATRLGFDHISAGDFMRQLAAERGLSVLELSRIAEHDPSVDRAIDERSATFGRERGNFVIDARLAWYFIPQSFKVFLDVSIEVATRRIYGDRRGTEHENVDLESTRASTAARGASESKRYVDYYGVDYLDPSHYDLVVDTSEATIEEIVATIVAAIPGGSTPRSGERPSRDASPGGPGEGLY